MRKIKFMDILTGSWELASAKVNDFITDNGYVLVDVKMQSIKIEGGGYSTILMVMYEEESD